MPESRQALKLALLDFIERGQGRFEALALRLFAYQHRHNPAYRAHCERRGASPDRVARWTEIPTVPTDVFRHVPLFCGQPSEATVVFRTSGTTSGRRGEHHLRSLTVYHASALRAIDTFLLPDGPHRPALMLAPPPEALPDSSLSSMLGLIARERAPDALFAWNDDGLDLPGALNWLTDASRRDAPVLLLATSFALVKLFDAMPHQRLTLPPGSIMMPTGGTKGRTREVTAAEIEALAEERLGVAADHVVSEYGMTELGSQFYDPRLAEALARKDASPASDSPRLSGPPWCRVTVHDPLTLAEVPLGEPGLLRFTDLSNLDSVCSVQTSDRGRLLRSTPQGDTLTLLGRQAGARPRGCSLLIEEMLT